MSDSDRKSNLSATFLIPIFLGTYSRRGHDSTILRSEWPRGCRYWFRCPIRVTKTRTFVVRGEYYFLALPSRFPFPSFFARPILSSLPISFSSAYPSYPSPTPSFLHCRPLSTLFFSVPVPPSLRLYASSNRYGIKLETGLESRWYDRVLVTISPSDIPARIS